MKKLLSLLLLSSLLHPCFSQNQHLIDSLQNQLKKLNATKLELGKYAPTMNDTLIAKILYRLSLVYRVNDPVKAMSYAEQTLRISEQAGSKNGMGNAYSVMGIIMSDKGDYSRALDLHKKSLKIREEIGDKEGIAGCYSNIGMVYSYQGNYPEALKVFLSSLKLHEEIGDKKGIAVCYNNIGNVYIFQANYPEALKNYFASIKIREKTGDKRGLASCYGNIGFIYEKQKKYPEALKYFLDALKIMQEKGDKLGIASSLINVGLIYEDQENYPEALKYYFNALKLAEEMGDKESIAFAQSNIGTTYALQKKFNEASQYLNNALLISKEIGNLEDIKQNYFDLSGLDSARGDFKQALEYYKLFIIARDSMINQENTKKIVQQQMQYDFDKKEALTKAQQEAKDALAQKELQKQKWVRNGFIGGFAVVLFFAFVFLWQRKKISREKKISEAEKERSEELLLNILPAEVATELKQTGKCQPKTFSMVTVMFADFKDFTHVSEKVSAELLVNEINYCFSAFDNILQKHGIEKIKTVGDAYMCASGLPTLNYTHATDMVMAALEIRKFILTRKKEKEARNEIAFELRIGIHTGPVVAGIVGVKKFQYDIWGDTVNIASRMESSCEAGQVNISGATHELVKDKFKCVHRGKIEAKHKGEIDMYFVSEK